MGTITTEYAVNLRYQMHNQAVLAGARAMSGELQRAHQASAAFGMSLGRLGGLLAGGVGLYQAKKSLLDFNSGMEQAQITMAGMMAQAGKGDFVGNMDEAAKLVKQMQLDARASVGTTEDFVQMATSIVQPLMMAKGTMQDLRDMTRQTVIASRAMGIGADVAGRDVGQALMGRYNTVDPFLSRILPAIGYAGEEGRAKWRSLKEAERLSELRRALGSKGIMDMGKAQETSFAGAASTLKDNIQMTLGKVGMPLFKAVTEELNKWNKWLDANQSKIHEMAKEIGGDLLKAARMFREAIGFVADHWKQILGTLTMMKSTGLLMAMSPGGQAGAAAIGSMALGGAGGLAGKLAVTGIVASAIYIGATSLVDYLEKKQDQDLEMASRYGVGVKGGTIDALIAATKAYRNSANDAERKSNAQVMMALAKNQGITGKESMETAAEYWSSDQRMAMARALGQKGGFDSNRGIRQEFGFVSASDVATAFDETRMSKVIQEWMPDRSGMGEGSGLGWMEKYNVPNIPKPAKIQQNVTIHRIEVASDDPDRMAIGFTDWLANIARNPSNAKHALREAG